MAVAYNPRAINLGFLNYFSQKPNNPADTVQGQIDALKGANAAVAAAGENGGVQAGGQTASGGTPTVNTTETAAGQAGTITKAPTMDTSGTAAGQAGTVTGQATQAKMPWEVNAPQPDANLLNTPEFETAKQVNKSDYQKNQEMVDWLLEKPMTVEERARRERAAHSIAGVGALGNVLNAFSNLAFATQAAPSQKLPEVPDAGSMVQKERDYWDKTRNAYLQGKMQGRQMDLREWQMAQQQENERVRGLNDVAMKRYQANVAKYGQEYKQYRDAIQDKKDRDKFDEDVRRYGLEYGLKQAQLAISKANLGLAARRVALAERADTREQERHNYLMQNGGYAGAGQGRGAGAGGAVMGSILSSPEASYTINKKLDDATHIANLYNGLPLAVRNEWEANYPLYSTLTGNDRKAAQLEAVMAQVAQDDSYAKRLQRDGYLSEYRGNGGAGASQGGSLLPGGGGGGGGSLLP